MEGIPKMRGSSLPRIIRKVIVPPIKCQGIKTRLVPFIAQSLSWQGAGRWIEPFLGSGVVLFNIRPKKAVACDINPHIIAFYQSLQNGAINHLMVREYLTGAGAHLLKYGEDYYYFVRDRFNAQPNPLDFLFLNRTSFNGLMRFNQSGGFNSPFCRKNDRLRKSYITKIVNQVRCVQGLIRSHDWEFRVMDYTLCMRQAQPGDFVYLDPPYIGRHTGYFGSWSEQDAKTLAEEVRQLPCGYALSMWKSNRYRSNLYLQLYREQTVERVSAHFYHIGATESLRNAVEEALLIRKGYEANDASIADATKPLQLTFSLGA